MAKKEMAMELTRDSLGKICKTAKDAGVTLALENMPKMAITACVTAQDILGLIEGTEMKICFDFGHANTAGGIDDFLRHSELFANIHIHDNDGKWDQHLIPGSGTVGFEKYMKRLKGYNGNYVFECRYLDDGIEGKERVAKLIG